MRVLQGQRTATLTALHENDAATAMAALAAERSPRPIAADELPSRFVMDAAELSAAARAHAKSGTLAAVGERMWIATGALAMLE